MDNNSLQYNTQRERLILPEYGRAVQDMVHHAVSIEDRAERNRCARTIVGIMANMFPQMKDAPDFKHKLWDQLFIISEFKLDVDSPYPVPEVANLSTKPDVVPYPAQKIRFKHYGHIIEDMIEKAIDTEDPEQKRRIVVNIANYMKNALLAWNKDFATDERLFNDIRIMSNGRLVIDEEDGIKTSAYHRDALPQPAQTRNVKRSKASSKKKSNRRNNNRSRY